MKAIGCVVLAKVGQLQHFELAIAAVNADTLQIIDVQKFGEANLESFMLNVRYDFKSHVWSEAMKQVEEVLHGKVDVQLLRSVSKPSEHLPWVFSSVYSKR